MKYPNRPIIYLVCDSHARALYQGLMPFLDERHIDLIGYSVIYCTPLSTMDTGPACAYYNEYILDRIHNRKPDLVIHSARHLLWSRDPAYKELVDCRIFIREETASLIKAGKSHVLIVGEIPNWKLALWLVLNQEYFRFDQAVPDRMFTGLVPESMQIDADMKSNNSASSVSHYDFVESR